MQDTTTFLTPEEAAIRAGVSRSLMYRLISERRIVHYRIGGEGKRGKVLIAPSDLESFLASCRVEQGPSYDNEDLTFITK